MIRSAAESGEYLELLTDRAALTHVLSVGAASIRECCGERASPRVAQPRVRCTGCGLLGLDMTASQFVWQHHERRAAARRPYLLRAGCMAARYLGAGRPGDGIESEMQGLHTEALQCAGYYRSHAFTMRDHFAAPQRGDPLSACLVARGEPTRGRGCRAWAPTDQ